MKRKSGQLGGMIIEVLVAAIILAGGLLSLISFQAELLRQRGLVSQEESALNIAQDKLQALRNYTVLATTVGQFAYADIVSGNSSSSSEGTTYTLTWTVTNNTAPIRKNVNVAVSWPDAVGTSHTFTLSTIIISVDPAASGKIAQSLP